VTDIEIAPWFGGAPITVQALGGTDKVAYSWSVPGSLTAAEQAAHVQTIDDLIVWHHCDKNLWVSDPTKDQSKVPDYIGWHPAGVGKHDLIAVDPLHIEASVYWPSCCGLHGWIRDGRWVQA
jgi:hypothetical protein